jgi:hypothetical protein
MISPWNFRTATAEVGVSFLRWCCDMKKDSSK